MKYFPEKEEGIKWYVYIYLFFIIIVIPLLFACVVSSKYTVFIFALFSILMIVLEHRRESYQKEREVYRWATALADCWLRDKYSDDRSKYYTMYNKTEEAINLWFKKYHLNHLYKGKYLPVQIAYNILMEVAGIDICKDYDTSRRNKYYPVFAKERDIKNRAVLDSFCNWMSYKNGLIFYIVLFLFFSFLYVFLCK